MPLEVMPVSGASDVRAFVELPFRLHTGTNWVPPLKLERYAYLNSHLGMFFKGGEAQLFLARRDGRVVGRVSAQISRTFNDFHDNRWGLFGFIEFEDDQAILNALLAAAEAWLRERGRDRMVGPMDFVFNDELGILIDGYDEPPMIRQPWHPPYYADRFAETDLVKAEDVFHWHLDVEGRFDRMRPILPKVAAAAREKHGITIRPMTRRTLKRDLEIAVRIYNIAWANNWGFIPYTEKDMSDLWFDYQLIFGEGWYMIAENPAGEPVAMAMTIPDINQVYSRMQGTLLPGGWLAYLRRNSFIDRVRVGWLGVLPEYEHTGIGAALYLEQFEMGARKGIRYGEAGWILESNRSMNRGLETMGGYISKTCRVFERTFEPDAVPAAPPDSVRRYVPPDASATGA